MTTNRFAGYIRPISYLVVFERNRFGQIDLAIKYLSSIWGGIYSTMIDIGFSAVQQEAKRFRRLIEFYKPDFVIPIGKETLNFCVAHGVPKEQILTFDDANNNINRIGYEAIVPDGEFGKIHKKNVTSDFHEVLVASNFADKFIKAKFGFIDENKCHKNYHRITQIEKNLHPDYQAYTSQITITGNDLQPLSRCELDGAAKIYIVENLFDASVASFWNARAFFPDIIGLSTSSRDGVFSCEYSRKNIADQISKAASIRNEIFLFFDDFGCRRVPSFTKEIENFMNHIGRVVPKIVPSHWGSEPSFKQKPIFFNRGFDTDKADAEGVIHIQGPSLKGFDGRPVTGSYAIVLNTSSDCVFSDFVYGFDTDLRQSDLIESGWDFDAEGLKTTINEGAKKFLQLPTRNRYLEKWCGLRGFEPKISDAGVTTLHVLKKLDTPEKISVLANKGVIKLIETIEKSKPQRIDYSDLKNWATENFRKLKRNPIAEITKLETLDILVGRPEVKCYTCKREAWEPFNVNSQFQCSHCGNMNRVTTVELNSKCLSYGLNGPFARPGLANGALSTALTHRFLSLAFSGTQSAFSWYPSFELVSPGKKKLEADLLYFRKSSTPLAPSETIFCECKSFASQAFTSKDFQRLDDLREAFPEAFVVLSTLKSFSEWSPYERSGFFELYERCKARPYRGRSRLPLLLTGDDLFEDLNKADMLSEFLKGSEATHNGGFEHLCELSFSRVWA